ncbi:hypothetical protein [Micromonospora carbonacea]|uniref:hypothetical protein n=1 Tax=Micromonospora carbonacea TaxID=47853 RepID=UPI003712AD02
MPNLTLTPNRLAVLRAVKAGDVKHHKSWQTGKVSDLWKVDEYTTKNVTGTCNYLTNTTPRLIRPGRRTGSSVLSPQVWELTDEGEKVLNDHDAAQPTASKEA